MSITFIDIGFISYFKLIMNIKYYISQNAIISRKIYLINKDYEIMRSIHLRFIIVNSHKN